MIYKTFILLPGHKTNMISASHRRILSLLHSSSSGIFSSQKNNLENNKFTNYNCEWGCIGGASFIEYVAW